MLTQPDIGYITQFLSQLNKGPSQCNWNAAKRVLCYLKGTWELGIVYCREPLLDSRDHGHATLWGYCDVNYVEDPCDWKLTSGYSFMLAGGPIALKSKKQSGCNNSAMNCTYLINWHPYAQTTWVQKLCQTTLSFTTIQSTSISDGTTYMTSFDPNLYAPHISLEWKMGLIFLPRHSIALNTSDASNY